MPLADRKALRERYRQRAIAQAELIGLTLRCQMAVELGFPENELTRAEHRKCRGEAAGGIGCLCRCHDNPGVAITVT